MNRSRLLIVIGFGLVVLARSAFAQSPPLDKAANKDKSAAKAEADRSRKERQAQARALLISLASDARSFREQTLRARSLARIADALWNVDAGRGRTLFREAWAAAEIGDRDSQEPLHLRQQVLNLVVKRDRLLAEEFLEKLKSEQAKPGSENSGSSIWALSDALQQRLTLAESLLRRGDIEQALQFADPVLGSVAISTVDFLTLLREKNPAAADQRYAAMLAITGGDPAADANTISLLSSYIFTPQMYVAFSTEGAASWSMPAAIFPPASVDPQLRLAFFQTAASVLLRPTQPPAEPDPGKPGIAGKYMVVKRLMPLFEQYAPRETTAAMRGQYELLNGLVGDNLRQGENEWTQKGLSPEKSFADQELAILDQIDHARTSDERDELYFKLAQLAVGKDDLKARDYAAKIEESWFRKRAQAWVDWGLASGAIRKKLIERALELSRKGDLTHIQRVWVLTQAAKLLAKTDRDQALSLLDDATAEARRIDGVDLDRPRGLLAIASAQDLIDPARAWDTLFDAVKAANSTEGFTGEDGALTVNISMKSQIIKKIEANSDFEIKGIFGKLANADYDRAVQLARGFQGEAARANATIAICQSVLNEN